MNSQWYNNSGTFRNGVNNQISHTHIQATTEARIYGMFKFSIGSKPVSFSSLPQIVFYFEKPKACKKKKKKPEEKNICLFLTWISPWSLFYHIWSIFRLWLNHSRISCSYPDTSPSDLNMYFQRDNHNIVTCCCVSCSVMSNSL